ncbi:glutathione S-transferase family protein [Salinisphaera sp. T31B1]|uniref:glutathione S-transferase family protein n=1 Tax=Salinisphaera sp. T31B1 TaxID=727963 RepID=UPI00333FDD4C
MAELTFYTNPMSRGRIVRWMLEETGVEYATEPLDYAGSMKAAPYRAINPMGKVPAIRHGQRVVTESAAICAYLADVFPQAELAPSAGERAAYYRWLFFAAGPLEQAMTHHALGFTPSEEQSRMLGYGTHELTTEVLADALNGQSYLAGDRFTAVDVYAGSQVIWGLRTGTLVDQPAFTAYADRLSARDAFQRASRIDDALLDRAEPPPT